MPLWYHASPGPVTTARPQVLVARPHRYQQGAALRCAVSQGKAGANPRAPRAESAGGWGEDAGRAAVVTPLHQGGPVLPGGLHTSRGCRGSSAHLWGTMAGCAGGMESPSPLLPPTALPVPPVCPFLGCPVPTQAGSPGGWSVSHPHTIPATPPVQYLPSMTVMMSFIWMCSLSGSSKSCSALMSVGCAWVGGRGV